MILQIHKGGRDSVIWQIRKEALLGLCVLCVIVYVQHRVANPLEYIHFFSRKVTVPQVYTVR